jgi:hypothetical protein
MGTQTETGIAPGRAIRTQLAHAFVSAVDDRGLDAHRARITLGRARIMTSYQGHRVSYTPHRGSVAASSY